MNAHTFPLPPSPAKGEVSREWHAVLRPFMGLREPVIASDGQPLMYESPGLAAAAASGHQDRSSLFICRSPLPPTIERIREVANAPRIPCPPVSFDIEAMDGWKTARQDARIGSSSKAWGR